MAVAIARSTACALVWQQQMPSMLQFLHSENIWRELSCQRSIAVPYISDDGGKLLHFKPDDVLVAT